MRLRRLAALALAAAALSGACGDDGATPTATTAAGAKESGPVILKSNQFRPKKVTVRAGESVTWEWDDGTVPHDVDGGDVFKSEVQETGTFEHTFEEAGTFEYKCNVHPTMTGSVEVTE